MMDQERFEEIVGNAETQSLNGIWSQLSYDTDDFQRRTELFLWILEGLMSNGRIKLHRKGVFLSGSVEEQLQKIRKAFPLSEGDADRICTNPSHEVPYKNFGMNVWWFLDACPASVAWRRADGDYAIDD